MITPLERAFSDASLLSTSIHATATKAVAAGRSSGGNTPYSGAAESRGMFEGVDISNAVKQYRAFRDIPFTAIRPIAVKIASLPWLAGSKGSISAPSTGKLRTKSFAYRNSPAFVRKQLTDGLEPDKEHPAITDLENPNPYMTGWALKFCTAASMELTGKSFWWIIPGLREDGSAKINYYYLPTSWVKPIHGKDRPFVGWRVTPPGQVEREDTPLIPYEDIAYFSIPDPADPLGSLSPLQSQARACNTDDEVQRAQFASMRNGINPGMVIQAGRLPAPPGQTGQGPRVELTPDQRNQLISAVRLAYAGAMHFNDPIILDALIEDVHPYTRSPAELGFLESSGLTKDRIMQGIGTNPIVAGQIEGANRASAYVAHDGFYDLVVNPLGTLISEVITNTVAPRYANPGTKTYIWIEEAKARDADLELAKMTAGSAARAVKVNEWREYLGLDLLEGDEGEAFAGPPEPPMEGPGGVETTKPKGKPPGGAGAGGAKKPAKKGRR
jgi:phage portal protein BeeE